MSSKIHTRKAVIVGAGRVGSHAALCLMFQHLVNEIVLLDVNPAAAAAQAGDLNDLASGLGDNFVIRVGDYSDCKDAHFVILTAGRSRRPGETRLQMLDGTIKILEGIVGPIRDSGFHSILISVSNPCDVVTEYLYRNLGLPRSQVFGTGTLLDSARLRRALSEIIGVNSKQIRPSAWASTATPRSSPRRTSLSRASICASTSRSRTATSRASTSTTS